MSESPAAYFIEEEKMPVLSQINSQSTSVPINSNLTWVSVLNFLQKEHTRTLVQEQEWEMQKKILNEKINRLQAQLDLNTTINADLINRIKLLEIALTESRLNRSTNQKKISRNSQQRESISEEVQKLMEKYKVEQKINEGGHQKFLKQIMADIGVSFKELPSVHEQVIAMENFSQEKQLSARIHAKMPNLKEQGLIVAHLDSVRGMLANDHKNFIVSISQDCVVKIWNYNSMWTNRNSHLQPQKSFRQHTGPLFALAGGTSPYNPQQSIFFTGGTEGIIKYWSVKDSEPQKTTAHTYWQAVSKNSDCGQAIWSLDLQKNKLLGTDSDGNAHLFQVNDTKDDNLDSLLKIRDFKELDFKSSYIKWVSSDNFIAGCCNAPRAHLWNINSGKVLQKLLYQIDLNSQAHLSQVNQIQMNKTTNILAAACEDSCIRLFNLSMNKMVRKIEIGQKNTPVGCLSFLNDWLLVAGTHTGMLSLIDLRKYKIVKEVKNCHNRKYDESIQCIMSRGESEIMTGGTDGVIKRWS